MFLKEAAFASPGRVTRVCYQPLGLFAGKVLGSLGRRHRGSLELFPAGGRATTVQLFMPFPPFSCFSALEMWRTHQTHVGTDKRILGSLQLRRRSPGMCWFGDAPCAHRRYQEAACWGCFHVFEVGNTPWDSELTFLWQSRTNE